MTVFEKGKLSIVNKAMCSIRNMNKELSHQTEAVPLHWSADTEATFTNKEQRLGHFTTHYTSTQICSTIHYEVNNECGKTLAVIVDLNVEITRKRRMEVDNKFQMGAKPTSCTFICAVRYH